MAFRSLIPWKKGGELAKRPERGTDPFEMLHREMDRLFDEFHRDFSLTPYGTEEGTWMPRVNVCENEKEVCVSAELPGMDEKNIDVSIDGDVLRIKGEKKDESEEKGRNFYRMERSFGSFERDIPLPGGVDLEKAEATFKKGVLNITLPKTREAQKEVKKIQVKA